MQGPRGRCVSGIYKEASPKQRPLPSTQFHFPKAVNRRVLLLSALPVVESAPSRSRARALHISMNPSSASVVPQLDDEVRAFSYFLSNSDVLAWVAVG